MIEVKLPFKGEHCETTATGVLMSHLGYELSEAMLFGLGEGLNYGIITWGSKGFPFLGGRIKTAEIVENMCRNLGLKLNMNRTSSVKKAWTTVKESLDEGIPVGLQLDCYHLNYFTSKIHFAGHFVAMVGYDEEYAYLIDTDQQGGRVKTTLESLALARSEKQPMYGKNLSFTIEKTNECVDMRYALKTAIVNNANAFLNPVISNFGYKGIERTAKDIKKWFKKSTDVKHEFCHAAMMMEKAGTGGALFRNIYRDFLGEAYDILGAQEVLEANKLFAESAIKWNHVTDLFIRIGETSNEDLLSEVKDILLEIKDIEIRAMEILKEI